MFRLDHRDGLLRQVADHRFAVPPDIADLGEFRRLHLDERRLGQFREPARNLGLPHSGRADHDDVLGDDFIAQMRRQPLASPPRAERNRHHPFGIALSDDVPVQLLDDLARRQTFQPLRLFVLAHDLP